MSIHVLPSKQNDWLIKASGDKSWMARRMLKKDAIAYARAIARARKAELVIHNKDGKIALKDSHGKDSKRRRG